VTPVELLRWGWLVLAALGAGRAGLNLRNVLAARARIVEAGINGVLKVRAKFSVFDCAISFAALLCGCAAGIAALLTQPVVALGSLVLEHVLLVWLAFNMAQGWSRVNEELLKEALEAQANGGHGRVKPE
jgi:hypothetical protein